MGFVLCVLKRAKRTGERQPLKPRFLAEPAEITERSQDVFWRGINGTE
jgi:hypothetical protein